ncbi:MAG: acetolactate synthase large subunit [Thermoguttaceae bacterium]
MKAAELFVRCLENEGVEAIFGLPGEENIDITDCLLDSKIRFISVRHEQAAAFMADVYGRVTGRAGVCLATLGPGATNLVTGVADANMDHAPVVAVSGQSATTRMHKESHQYLDLVNLFRPISKFSIQVIEPETIPEVVRKAFKTAQAEKPGVSYIDLPENVAQMEVEGKGPLAVQAHPEPHAAAEAISRAAEIINSARFPLIMAGNGVIRARASEQLIRFGEKLNIPVANTFMAKGVVPFSHALWLGSVGLQAKDYAVACGFDRADVIVCVGYDMVEYHANRWNSGKDRKIIHVDLSPAEVDEFYIPAVEVVGEIGAALDAIAQECRPQKQFPASLWQAIMDELSEHAYDDSFPLKPQRLVWDLQRVFASRCTVVCDVGAHKMWMARMYQPERPNTCIISNGFAAMGISLPGAIAAKLAFPNRTVAAVTGDAGFMMNSQEIETALRIGTPVVIVIWNDGGYGLIGWHQLRRFGRTSHVDFGNPDFVKYAESFGAKGYRVSAADELMPILKQAIADNTVVVVDCPVDYSENMKLTERLSKLVCPV